MGEGRQDDHGDAAARHWFDLAAHLILAHGTNPQAIGDYAPTLGQLQADHHASHASLTGDGIVFGTPTSRITTTVGSPTATDAAFGFLRTVQPAPCWQVADSRGSGWRTGEREPSHNMTGPRWSRTLRIRRCDLDRLTRAGLTAAASWGHGQWDRRDRLSVSLYRTGDLDDLAAHADMDWHAVRATVPGRRSPLAALPSAPGRRATMTKIFWIDHEHDRDAASDGASRYGFYLRDRRDWFEDCLDCGEPQTARFAATAWRIATGPVMSPGYVRCHRRVRHS